MTTEQMSRLYRAAKDLKGIEGQSAVAVLMGETPQTLSNWEAREISSRGLLTAQEVIGCDAIWLRDGAGSMRHSLDDLLKIARRFAEASQDGRQAILEAARKI